MWGRVSCITFSSMNALKKYYQFKTNKKIQKSQKFEVFVNTLEKVKQFEEFMNLEIDNISIR